MFEMRRLRRSSEGPSRAEAAQRLGERGPDTARVLTGLVAALADENERVSDVAAEAISRIINRLRGSRARAEVTTRMVPLLLDSRTTGARGRTIVNETLARLGDKRAVPYFLSLAETWLLDRVDPQWRGSDALAARIDQDIAALASVDQGPDARAVIARLQALCPTWTDRAEARSAIPSLIRFAYYPTVWDALEALDPAWRESQREAFYPIVSSLLEILEQPASRHTDLWAARRALRAVGDERAVPLFLSFIMDDRELEETAHALRRVVGSEEALLLLQRLLADSCRDGQPVFRSLTAALALKAIDETRATTAVAASLTRWRWHWGASGASGGTGHTHSPSDFYDRWELAVDGIVAWLWSAKGVRVLGPFVEALVSHYGRDHESNYGVSTIV